MLLCCVSVCFGDLLSEAMTMGYGAACNPEKPSYGGGGLLRLPWFPLPGVAGGVGFVAGEGDVVAGGDGLAAGEGGVGAVDLRWAHAFCDADVMKAVMVGLKASLYASRSATTAGAEDCRRAWYTSG